MLEIAPPLSGISYFKYAKQEADKSTFRCKVGACLVIGKSIFRGHNKAKTHPKFANPEIHLKKSLHAECDCIITATNYGMLSDLYMSEINKFPTIYVYRETADGQPAMAKPCEHCQRYLRAHGIFRVIYSTYEYPHWKEETI